MSQPRRILLVVHPSRPEVHDHALGVVKRLTAAGVSVAGFCSSCEIAICERCPLLSDLLRKEWS